MLTRKSMHKELDRFLDKCGYGEEIDLKFGSILMEVKVQHGEENIVIRERERVTPLSSKTDASKVENYVTASG
ncbi:MAG: hypothetical protein V3T23_06185 [Nitrososphaerales archaeon]